MREIDNITYYAQEILKSTDATHTEIDALKEISGKLDASIRKLHDLHADIRDTFDSISLAIELAIEMNEDAECTKERIEEIITLDKPEFLSDIRDIGNELNNGNFPHLNIAKI